MRRPSPRQVFDDPEKYWGFLTQNADDNFEDQHFDRKEAGLSVGNVTNAQISKLQEQIKETISAFANSNVEGGLLVLGISSQGVVKGIDHLSEEQRNSLLNFSTFLHHQAAEVRYYQYTINDNDSKTICLVFVPFAANGICETPGSNPKAWVRIGSQNIPMTQDIRDRIRDRKGLTNYEGAFVVHLIKMN